MKAAATVEPFIGSEIASRIVNKSVFIGSLCAASLVPFFIGALASLELIGYQWLVWFLGLLALLHVPLTVYLFTDPAIRSRMKSRPLLLIGVPILLVVGSVFMFLNFSWDLGSSYGYVLFYFVFLTVAWQHWHFGKQNLGVFAFSCVAAKRGPIKRFERATIVGAAISGVLVTYHMVGAAFKDLYAPNGDPTAFQAVMPYMTTMGKAVQYTVTAASVYYVARNWRSFSFTTGTLYLIGANFFLPQYLYMDLTSVYFIFGQYIAAHGVQYVVFLLFHALGTARNKAAQTSRFSVVLLAPVIFVVVAFVIADLYMFGKFVSMRSLVGTLVSGFHLTALELGKVVAGVINGVLLSHFWLDAFYWRLKDKPAREWVQSRYSFLFK